MASLALAILRKKGILYLFVVNLHEGAIKLKLGDNK